MSFAYFPLYTGDYLRDTRHLTPLRHGAYLLLLMHCWDTKGPAPLDEAELCGIANCRSDDEVQALRYVITRFFTKMEDGHYSLRLQKEIEKAENISRERSDAGRKGYEARAKHLLNKSQASASNPTPIPYHPHTIGKQKRTHAPLSAPSDEHRMLAKTAKVDCDLELAKYLDWLKTSGKKHKDQTAGFRNWLRKATPTKRTAHDVRMDVADQLYRRGKYEQPATERDITAESDYIPPDSVD